MTRSLRTTGAMATAAQSAMLARAWLQPVASRRAIVTRAGRPLPRAVLDRMVDHERIRARTGDVMPDLLAVLRSEPALGPWLERPEALARLHLTVGAMSCGARLRGFVKRAAVAAIIDRIGRPAWDRAVHQDGGKLVLTADADDTLQSIEREGAAAVVGYFRAVAPPLLPAMEAGIGVRWSQLADREPGDDDITLTRAVIADLGP